MIRILHRRGNNLKAVNGWICRKIFKKYFYLQLQQPREEEKKILWKNMLHEVILLIVFAFLFRFAEKVTISKANRFGGLL